jgi:UDP-N-acetyl-D-mannosaminuronate dehydrogenase
LSVGIVGLGHVGLPLAVSFAEAGELVIGVEINPDASRSCDAASPTSRISRPPACR